MKTNLTFLRSNNLQNTIKVCRLCGQCEKQRDNSCKQCFISCIYSHLLVSSLWVWGGDDLTKFPDNGKLMHSTGQCSKRRHKSQVLQHVEVFAVLVITGKQDDLGQQREVLEQSSDKMNFVNWWWTVYKPILWLYIYQSCTGHRTALPVSTWNWSSSNSLMLIIL